MSSYTYCENIPYTQQRAELLSSYQSQTMSYESVPHVNDSYTFRVAPELDLAVESYLPCEYAPTFKASSGPRPRKAAIIFLHDFGGSSCIFKRIIDGCRCHCITIDFRGCGGSCRAQVSRYYSVAQLVKDVERILPNLEHVTDFVLVGHGMGAKIAQIIASDQLKGLIGLALINPVPASPWILSDSSMGRLYGSCATATEALAFVNNVLSAYPGSLKKSDLDAISTQAMRQDTALTIAWLRDGPEGKEGDWSGALGRIKVPVVAIAGMSDKLISVDKVKDEVYDKIYGCIMVKVEDAGHLLPLERPKKLLRELHDFVDACVEVRKNGSRSSSLLYQAFCMARETDECNFIRSQGL